MERPIYTRDKQIDINFHSQQHIKKYDLVLIGGGPSALAFICSLFQKNIIDKLIPSCNILIIEKHETFGSGCLGKYGINTNTSAEGFIRLLCLSEEGKKDKSGKLALSPNKNRIKKFKDDKDSVDNKLQQHIFNINHSNIIPEKIDSDSIINKIIPLKEKIILKRNPLFNEIFSSSTVQSLLALGDKPAPLGLVANFLETVGNYVIHHIASKFGKNIFMNRTEVKCVKIGNDDEFRIHFKDVKEFESNTNSDSQFIIKAKCIVLSTGGKQNLNNPLYHRVLKIKGDVNVFISDHILQEHGYNLIKNRISLVKEKHSDTVRDDENVQDKVIVTIIGGSHSGFSCAWILLNKPTIFYNNKECNNYIPRHITNCQRCMINSNNGSNKILSNKNSQHEYISDHTGTNKYYLNNIDNSLLTKQVCTCYGKVNDNNWSTCHSSQIDTSKDIDIEIHVLYRDRIRVYYPSREEAAKDNYSDFDDTCINQHGKIYPFVGLRGDAKELYRKVVKGEEKRIKLINTPTDDTQIEHIKLNSDIVIWACGYETNHLPFYDSKNNPIEFLTDCNGTVEVNSKLNILNKNNALIKNLFGIGQGYSTKAPEIINGKQQRADSIHLYSTHIASKLLKSLGQIFDKFILKDINSNKPIIHNNSNKIILNNCNLSTNIGANLVNNISNYNNSNHLANSMRRSSVNNSSNKTRSYNTNIDNNNNIHRVKSTLVITGKYIMNITPLHKIEEIPSNHLENIIKKKKENEISKHNIENLMNDDKKKITLTNYNYDINKRYNRNDTNKNTKIEKNLKEKNMNSIHYKSSLINPICLGDHMISKPKRVSYKSSVDSSENTMSMSIKKYNIKNNSDNIKVNSSS